MDLHCLTILTEKLLNFFFYQFTIKERQKYEKKIIGKVICIYFFSCVFLKKNLCSG